MIIYLNFDFVVIYFGLLVVCWYGFMYFVGFIVVIVVGWICLKLLYVVV